MEGTNFSLSWIDYAIVAVYFIGIIAHGIYISRKTRTAPTAISSPAARSPGT